MTKPSFTYNKDGSLLSASGFEAVDCVRVASLIAAIGLLIDTKGQVQPFRGFTLTKALKMANRYTGVKYKRTKAAQAKADLKVWLESMKSTIPATTVGDQT